jgi:hypothetical protein
MRHEVFKEPLVVKSEDDGLF